MKEGIKLFFLIAVLFISGIIIFKIIKKVRKKESAEKSYKELPKLNFFFIKDAMIGDSTPVILNYFSPSCNHCQYMAKQLVSNSEKLKKIKYVLIGNTDEKSCRDFIVNYNLKNLPFLAVALDTSDYFGNTFQTVSIPSFFVYNTDKSFAGAVKGEVKIEYLLNFIKK